MIQQKLGGEWVVWYLYEGDKSTHKQVDYDRNLEDVVTVTTAEELAFVWKQTPISNIQNFFVNFKTGVIKKYSNEKVVQPRKVEALCFFRQGIQPTWEDPKNKVGAQFTFFLTREQMDSQPIYEQLVFSVLGGFFKNGAYVNGVRFVDKFNERRGEANVKIEIWVGFREANRELVDSFSSELLAFTGNFKLTFPKLEFKDI